MTPLQQAVKNLIDRWNSPIDWPEHLALRKALDAEIAQSVEPERCGYDETTGNCTKNPCCNLSANQAKPVEPFAYFNIGTEYHVKGKIIFHKGLTPNLEDRWWGPDTPLYLHPPQQAKQVPMTDNEIARIAQLTQSAEPGNDGYILPFTFARAIEAHHNINK